MSDGWSLLFELVVTLSAALLMGLLLERLKQSAILGYILAGAIVGPTALGWVQAAEDVKTLSELGVALLLFTIGLEFSWRRLLQLGKIAFLGGSIQVVIVLAVTTGLGLAMKLPLATAVTLGAVVSLASTAVVLRVLKDSSELDTQHGKACIGMLLMQDIAVVPLVMLVTILGGGGSSGGKGSLPIGTLLLNTAMLVAILVAVVTILLPRLLQARAFAKNRELPILTAITVCMASAWGAFAAGLSPALGAFMAGMLLAESRFAEQIRADVFPLKTIFVTLFFASIGLSLNVTFLGQHAGIVALGVLVVMLGKTMLTFVACRPFSPSIVTSIAAAIALSQMGEFSFVLAKIGRTNGLLDDFLFQLVISVSVFTLLLTPLVVTHSSRWGRRLAVRLFNVRKVAQGERSDKRELSGHIVVIGFGQAGQSAVRALDGSGHSILCMDIDPAMIDLAKELGHLGRVGDASQSQNLMHARVPEAAGLIVALPDTRLCRMILGHAKRIAPTVPAVARARYHIFADELDLAGADVVVDEEMVVGTRLGEELFRLLVPVEPVFSEPGHSQR